MSTGQRVETPKTLRIQRRRSHRGRLGAWEGRFSSKSGEAPPAGSGRSRGRKSILVIF